MVIEAKSFPEEKLSEFFKKDFVEVYTDGASRGNPGESGIGFLIKKNNKTIFEKSFYIGLGTNNFAEYFSLVTAAFFIEKNYKSEKIEVFSDSLLLVKQLNNEYKVKNLNLKKAKIFLDIFFEQKNVNFLHIPREKNKIADMLANKGIDEKIPLPEDINRLLIKMRSNN